MTVTPGLALFPVRLFLGGTFCYAGIQKLTDPGYLHPGAPTYIGTQLQSFSNGTPGGFILHTFALPHPELAGVGVAIFEILVGLLMLLGLTTRLAAAGGLALNLLLFLTASWHTHPYFLGSDIVFVFAWLPFVFVGAAEQPALDNALEHPSPALARRTRLHPQAAGSAGASDEALTRRALLAEVGAAALALAGISALLRGPYTGPTTSGATSGRGTSGGSSSVPSGAVKIGPSSRLPAGQASLYRDPGTGQPDIVIRQPNGDLTAFSAVCTHAGCTVSYQGGQIVCPCHGGVFSATTGAVEAGPPPQPLPKRTVLEHGGEIYAAPS